MSLFFFERFLNLPFTGKSPEKGDNAELSEMEAKRKRFIDRVRRNTKNVNSLIILLLSSC